MPGAPLAAPTSPSRTVLFLAHDWGPSGDAITHINQAIARYLAGFHGVRVVSTILCDLDHLPTEIHKAAQHQNIHLIAPGDDSEQDLSTRLHTFNANPLDVFPSLQRHVPEVSHIFAHSPYTSSAALRLKQELYPQCKVVLLYHVIPEEVALLANGVLYSVPSDQDLLQQAEQADVVFSVTEKLYFYFSAKFRNRARQPVDHRLFLPQPPATLVRVQRSLPLPNSAPKIFTFAFTIDGFALDGVDIAACAVNKLALAHVDGSSTWPMPSLVVGCRLQSQVEPLRQFLAPFLICPDLKVDYPVCNSAEALAATMSAVNLCLVPCRGEPYGSVVRMALSAGVPTLLAKHCSLAPTLARLAADPELQTVHVTPSEAAVRQDATVWRDRMLAVLKDMPASHQRALQLQNALRRDERTRETLDDLANYCLGSISLRHEITAVDFHVGRDERREVAVLHQMNQFLGSTLRLCWRLKHHALAESNDVRDLWGDLDMPLATLTKRVTDKVEEYDRRILGYDEKTRSFLVYCPTPAALSDLWAMCDVINKALMDILFHEDESSHALAMFEVKSAQVRTLISGPEFLQYKGALVHNSRPNTAAF